MRELAETLKRRAGLRMRQGVVTAVDGSTCRVLIGGSTVPVDGVQHLNSCSPKVDDVVWITSDGADLWIMGTHGAPPPIDPELLPAFSTYFTDADTEGDPDPVTGAAGAAVFGVIVLAWDLPPEALWRTWRVYEGTEDGFTPGEPILETPNNVVRVQRAAGSGPWYYKVRAVNSRGEVSTDVQVGPLTVPEVGTSDIAADAVTAAKIKAGEITASKLNVTDVQAAVVTAAAINVLALDAVTITGGEISGVSITGQTITGGTVQTAAEGNRVAMEGAYTDGIQFYSGLEEEQQQGRLEIRGTLNNGAVEMYLLGPSQLSSLGFASISLRGYDTFAALLLQAGNTWLTIDGGSGDVTIKNKPLSNPPCCIIRRGTDQAIASAATTTIVFSSAVLEKDEGGMWDTGAPSVLTVQEAGVYLLDACVSFAGNSAGYRYLEITRNGTAVGRVLVGALDTNSPRLHVSALATFAVGDTVSIRVRQTSGGSLNIVSEADFSPRFSAMYMRP